MPPGLFNKVTVLTISHPLEIDFVNLLEARLRWLHIELQVAQSMIVHDFHFQYVLYDESHSYTRGLEYLVVICDWSQNSTSLFTHDSVGSHDVNS